MRYVPLLFLLVWPGSMRAENPSSDELARYERTLRDHSLPAKGPELLRFFRDRTLSSEQIAQLAAKVEQLGSAKYTIREKAAVELVKAGQLAKPFLLELTRNPKADTEAVRRAELCLRKIANGTEGSLAVATAYLIARDRPDEAADVLIHFTPFATDPGTIEALQHALNALAMRAGKPEPVLVAAVADKSSSMRAAAGEALIRGGGLRHKPLVEHLLNDEAVQVRLQVALALVGAKDKQAVAPLIALLTEVPADQAWPAEDLLQRLAGESGPTLCLDGKTPAAKVRAAWQGWWEKNEGRADFARLDQTVQLQGYTLVTLQTTGAGAGGRVMELKPNRETHWKIDGLRYPLDAQVIGRERVLIAEYLNNKVTERDYSGNILWEKSCSLPIACQRLPNGDTFIATRRNVMIVDRDGKETFTYLAPNGSISAAQRARNGELTLVTNAGLVRVLDAAGKELRSFQAGQIYTMGSNVELLPGGRVLLPLYRDNRVAEFDATGKVVWQATVPSPTSVVRLPNGNTLVGSALQSKAVELNREGREVWSYTLEGRPWRVRKR